MPAQKTHAMLGAAAGAGAYLLACDQLQRPVSVGELFASAALGAVIGVLPDVIEPAIHSWHRGFGHSLTLGAGLASIAVHAYANESAWTTSMRIVSAVVVAAYLSHIVADGMTPRGIPLLQ